MRFKFYLSLLLIVLSINACKPNSNDEPSPEFLDKEHLFNLLNNWYLWNQTLPQEPDLEAYKSTSDLLDQVRFSSYDRWSSISDAEAFTSYYEEGTYFGYGFSYGFNDDDELRIKYVFENSPFAEAGVERGWILTHIDGADVQTITDWSTVFGDDSNGFTQNFTFIDSSGESTELTITKDVVTINAVLYTDVIDTGTETIGYIVFNNFIEPAIEELDNAFDLFEGNNIDRLILDLRYNGGGRISVATYLANYLIETHHNGKILFRYVHNEDKTPKNDAQILRKKGLLNLDELIVLTTSQTASASELVLNGLKPLINVTHIGDSNTYGKPVGSYSWYSLDEASVYTLISFKFLNSTGNGEFFDGIEPDFTACDDLAFNWGNNEESMLSAALQYIETGDTDGCSVQAKTINKNRKLPVEGYYPTAITDMQ